MFGQEWQSGSVYSLGIVIDRGTVCHAARCTPAAAHGKRNTTVGSYVVFYAVERGDILFSWMPTLLTHMLWMS
jgi:hypothetical protein